ncbi:hypothetical protein TNCV_1189841 [Trichonephila clavipes]|nr:hypothetical protein TNCV_1189841 [Trichonephila clavipes]
MQEYLSLANPREIYNLEECGLEMNNEPGKIIAKKGLRNIHHVTSGEVGETITVVTCCNVEELSHILKKNMQITGNHQMAWMVRHNDESVERVYKEWWQFGLETRYSAVASPIRSAQTIRLPATTANATGLPAQPTPCTHTKRASDFCSPFQGYLV